MVKNNRRKFIGKTAIGLFGALPMLHSTDLIDSEYFTSHDTNTIEGKVDVNYPTTDINSVRAIVGASHTQFDKVKELVTARPELAKASMDWGWGDWETALGAASHMGRKDIAEFLLAHGARPNLFTYAMLGKLSAVKAIIEYMPGVQKILGPHGFTLMHHAQIRLRRKNVEGAEKDQQEALVDYLKSLGDANVKSPALDISSEEQKTYLGKYSFGKGEDEYFEVSVNRQGNLAMARGAYFGRSLLRQDTHAFAPGGGPSVRIIFDVVDEIAQSVTVHDPTPIVKAIRV